jgi:hypothetical protein
MLEGNTEMIFVILSISPGIIIQTNPQITPNNTTSATTLPTNLANVNALTNLLSRLFSLEYTLLTVKLYTGHKRYAATRP